MFMASSPMCDAKMSVGAIRNVRLNLAGGVKQFVMFRESGIERRQKLWNVKMTAAQGRRSKGRRDMPTLLGDLLLFSCLAVWVSGIVIAIASLLS